MMPLRKTLAAAALTAVAIATTGLPTPAKADPATGASAYGYNARPGHPHGHRLANKTPHRVVRRLHNRRGFRRGRRVVIFNRGTGVRPFPYYLYAGRTLQFGLFGGLLGGGFGFPTVGHRLR